MIQHQVFLADNTIFSLLDERQCFEFALFYAEKVFPNLSSNKVKADAQKCIDLANRWLEFSTYVTAEDFNIAWRTMVVNASQDFANVIFSDLCEMGVCLTTLTNEMRRPSVHAIVVLLNSTINTLDRSFLYNVVANSFLSTTETKQPFTDLECKLIYLLDDTDEDVIIHHDNKFFINMNGIQDCPEYGFDTREELLDTILVSNDVFWRFVRKWLNRLYP
jgi:hypothetical protein